jgi:hypothetical protein
MTNSWAVAGLRLIGLLLASGGYPACAQPWDSGITTASVGVDYSQGDYGSDETTRTLALPVTVKHHTADWLFRATLPYVWAEGTFSRDLGVDISNNPLVATDKRTEAGPGDLTVGVFHHLVNSQRGLAADVGVKVKFATADKSKELLTSGKNDYSLQADVFQPWRRFSLFATLGYTRKGDPEGVDYHDPFYGSLGSSMSLAGRDSLGIVWDFRQRVTPRGDPISELTLFYTHHLSATDKLQVYGLQGLADGSPDLGGGLVFSRAY